MGPKSRRDKEFGKWAGGLAETQVDPRDLSLFQRAQLCRMFPAYTIESARFAPASAYRAMRLIQIAERAQG